MDKVIGGTPRGTSSLCKTCRFAHNLKGVNMQESTTCQMMNFRVVTFPVDTCSRYDDKRMPSLYDMEQIAWIVRSRARGPAGFAGDEMVVEIERPNMPGEVQRPMYASEDGTKCQ